MIVRFSLTVTSDGDKATSTCEFTLNDENTVQHLVSQSELSHVNILDSVT